MHTFTCTYAHANMHTYKNTFAWWNFLEFPILHYMHTFTCTYVHTHNAHKFSLLRFTISFSSCTQFGKAIPRYDDAAGHLRNAASRRCYRSHWGACERNGHYFSTSKWGMHICVFINHLKGVDAFLLETLKGCSTSYCYSSTHACIHAFKCAIHTHHMHRFQLKGVPLDWRGIAAVPPIVIHLHMLTYIQMRHTHTADASLCSKSSTTRAPKFSGYTHTHSLYMHIHSFLPLPINKPRGKLGSSFLGERNKKGYSCRLPIQLCLFIPIISGHTTKRQLIWSICNQRHCTLLRKRKRAWVYAFLFL